MKQIFLILFIFNILLVFPQENFQGKYVNKDDYLIFEGKQVDLLMQSNGGLRIPLKGKGNYQLIDDFLIIQTGELKEIMEMQTFENQDNYLKFEIVSGEKPAIVMLDFLNDKGEVLKTVSTDKHGKAQVKKDATYTQVRIRSFMGLVFEIPVQNQFSNT